MNFVNVSSDIMATIKSRALPVGNKFLCMAFANSHTEKVCDLQSKIIFKQGYDTISLPKNYLSPCP